MSHGRKPRVPRRVSNNPIGLARNNATLLTPTEIAGAINPLRAAAQALREGVATADQWGVVQGALTVAQVIETQGVVRGLVEHLRSAQTALDAIEQRAMSSGTWSPTALHYYELDHLTTAVDLHEFQMQRLSYREFRNALWRATAQIRSAGGRVVRAEAIEALAA